MKPFPLLVRASARMSVIALCLMVPGSGQAFAQESPGAPAGRCDAGPISYVFIDNHSVFDTSQEDQSGPLKWAYGAANSLHIRTRRGFIERELLFRPGDCLDPFLIQESGRILRQYRFLASADVYALAQPDGTNHVVVDTWDEWSTQLELSVAVSGGFQLRRLELTELNLLGRGILLSAFFRERREIRETGVEVQAPQLFRSRWDGRLSVGRTRVGEFLIEEISYPFLGEVGQVAARHQFAFRENLFAYSTPEDLGYSNVLLPFEERRVEFTAARRCCEPRRLTMFGLGLTYEGLTFPDFPESVETVQGGNFDDRRPADSVAVATVGGQAVGRKTTRLNILMGRRQVAFAQRRRLDAIDGVQDVAFGWEIQGTTGLSLPFLTPNAELDAPQDLFLAGQLFYGDAPRTGWVISTAASAETRYVFDQGDGRRGGWRDVILEFDYLTYFQPGPDSRHTLLGRVAFGAGYKMEMPFQLTLGGEDNLRGYSEEDFPGGQRVIVSLEDRIRAPSPLPNLFDLGFTAFVDVGRMWAGDVPYGASSGVQGDVGVGLRFGFPSGTRRVVRFDLAVPVGSNAGFGNMVFRISADELLGLINGVESRQLRRSRRSGVSAGLFDSPVR